MAETPLTIPQIYAQGKENLKARGIEWTYPPGRKMGPSVRANRKYLDSLFLETRFFDPVQPDTSFTLFGRKLKTPVFCSAISKQQYSGDNGLAEIGKGLANAGSMLMLGIGGGADLQSAIDSGVPVVKIIKPYRKTDLMYEKVRDAESRGCVALGMDIDHFYGVLMEDRALRTDTFAPQTTAEIKQVMAASKLPFIIKGVLSLTDAEKAVQLGASAIVVSNHGSGSLEFGLPSLIALPEIVQAVGNRVTVLVDTGFETGNDVFKGLALGAKAVGLATPIILAHCADGAQGVETLVNLVTAELQRTMAATGCANVAAINESIIREISFPE